MLLYAFFIFTIKVTNNAKLANKNDNPDCTIENGQMKTIKSECEEYKYISSNCDDCSLSYKLKSSLVILECTFIQTKDVTMISLERNELNILESRFKLVDKANEFVNTRMIKMLVSSLNMEGTNITGDSIELSQSTPNIESIDPVKYCNFSKCEFENIHCQQNSGSGIYIYNSRPRPKINIIFNYCTAFNTRSDANGGFYCQTDNMGILIVDNCILDNCYANKGGALFINGEYILQSTVFNHCESKKAGSDIFICEDDTEGLIFMISSCIFTESEQKSSLIEFNFLNESQSINIMLDNCTFANNTLYINSISGIIINGLVDCLIFYSCLFNDNQNMANKCFFYLEDFDLNLTKCIFMNNYGTGGFAIQATETIKLYIDYCLFDQYDLGVLYSNSDNTFIQNTVFQNFLTEISRRPSLFIFHIGDHMLFTNCTFNNIAAKSSGGLGISFFDRILEIKFDNCIFNNCKGPYDTYGLFHPPILLRNLTFESCLFKKCFCMSESLIYIDDGENLICDIYAQLINTSFTECETAQKQGMIGIKYYHDTARLFLTGCSFSSIPSDEVLIFGSVAKFVMSQCTFIEVGYLFNITMKKSNVLDLNGVTVENCTSCGPLFTMINPIQIQINNSIFKNLTGFKNDCIDLQYNRPIDLFIVENCSFIDNIYSRNGINLFASTLGVLRSNFTGNKAEYGAGLFIVSKTYVIIENCVFFDNTATKSGGCMYFESKVTYVTVNVTACNNYAKKSGAFVHMFDPFNDNLPTFNGNGNVSPNGVYSVEGGEIKLFDIKENNVSFCDANLLEINQSSNDDMVIRVENIEKIDLGFFNMKLFEAQGKYLNFNSSVFTDSKTIKMSMSQSITLSNVTFINSPNVKLEAPEIIIMDSKFTYSRRSPDQSQLLVRSTSNVTILRSCFISEVNNLMSGDYLMTMSHIVLNIDNFSCFDKSFEKSIFIPENSIINVGNAFNCKENCFEPPTADDSIVEDKPINTLAIAIAIPIIVIIIIIVTVTVVCMTREESKKYSSDSQTDLEDVPKTIGELTKTGNTIENDGTFLGDFEEG